MFWDRFSRLFSMFFRPFVVLEYYNYRRAGAHLCGCCSLHSPWIYAVILLRILLLLCWMCSCVPFGYLLFWHMMIFMLRTVLCIIILINVIPWFSTEWRLFSFLYAIFLVECPWQLPLKPELFSAFDHMTLTPSVNW